MIKDYYELTKPGLVYGNLIPLIGGFALGAQGAVSGVAPAALLPLLFSAIIGLMLVMASGCVFNNYIDRDIDARMERTRHRPLVAGRISPRSAFVFGISLGIVGFLVLALGTNLLTVETAALGFFFYIFMYSLWSKRRTMYAVVIGAFAGAVPPVVGYTAAAGRIDLGAGIIFLMLVLWQLPHFFAIAIRRADDYAAANIPVLPGERGIRTTKIKMMVLIILYLIASASLALYGYADQTYLVVVVLFGCVWFALAVQGFWVEETRHWARGMFFFSLIVLMATFIAMTVGTISALKF